MSDVLQVHLDAYCRCAASLHDGDSEELASQMKFHWSRLSPEGREKANRFLSGLTKENCSMSTATATTFESRWGHHPVSYETFRKLKTLHRRYYETVRAVARWVRWDRKTVNQTGPEPAYCPAFVDEKGHWRSIVHKVGDQEFKGMKWYPKTLNDRGIIEAYQAARTPAKTPEEVNPIKLSEEQIDRLYNEVEAWFAKQGE